MTRHDAIWGKLRQLCVCVFFQESLCIVIDGNVDWIVERRGPASNMRPCIVDIYKQPVKDQITRLPDKEAQRIS